MTLLVVSFLAGALTVAAPCILTLLPVIVGGSIATSGEKPKNRWSKPLIITASLAVSVILFSLLLKATTALLGVPAAVWQAISAVIIIFLGVSFLYPPIWEKLAIKIGLVTGSSRLMAAGGHQPGTSRDIIIGASLGPVFASCSPTYFLIVAQILPATFIEGFSYLLAYAAGLSIMLLLIAIVGQALVRRLGWLANLGGGFRRIIGILFIVVGLSILFGLDKKAQTFVLERGWYDPIGGIEQKLR